MVRFGYGMKHPVAFEIIRLTLDDNLPPSTIFLDLLQDFRMLKMAAPMKQTWAVRNYLFSKRKHFKSLSICRRNVQESAWKNGNIGKVEIDIENG